MKKKWKMTVGILTVLFCMLIGCQKKETKDFLILSEMDEIGESVGAKDAESACSGTEGTAGEEAVSQVTKEELAVHICGAVHNPGVYFLADGSRIYQAVEAAGGFTKDAGEEYLNLAGLLTDGQKIYIPTRQEAEEENLSENGQGNELTAMVDDGKVNINTASEEMLCTLPGIGTGKAQNIITYREEQGVFKTTEEIMNVDGIKEGLFQKIRDKITV